MVKSFDPSAPHALRSVLPGKSHSCSHHPGEPHAGCRRTPAHGWLSHTAGLFGVRDKYVYKRAESQSKKAPDRYFWGSSITPVLLRPSTVRAMAKDLEARLTEDLVRENDTWCRRKKATCADAFTYALQWGGATEFTLDQIYQRAVLDDRYPEPEFHREITPHTHQSAYGVVMHWGAHTMNTFLRDVRKVGTSSPSDAFFIGIHQGSEKGNATTRSSE